MIIIESVERHIAFNDIISGKKDTIKVELKTSTRYVYGIKVECIDGSSIFYFGEITIVFIITLTGCTDVGSNMDYSGYEYELNIGNKGRMAVSEDFIYYSDVNDNHNL